MNWVYHHKQKSICNLKTEFISNVCLEAFWNSSSMLELGKEGEKCGLEAFLSCYQQLLSMDAAIYAWDNCTLSSEKTQLASSPSF